MARWRRQRRVTGFHAHAVGTGKAAFTLDASLCGPATASTTVVVALLDARPHQTPKPLGDNTTVVAAHVNLLHLHTHTHGDDNDADWLSDRFLHPQRMQPTNNGGRGDFNGFLLARKLRGVTYTTDFETKINITYAVRARRRRGVGVFPSSERDNFEIGALVGNNA